MPYVERDGEGIIKATYNMKQPGYAEEKLSDEDTEVVTFVTSEGESI